MRVRVCACSKSDPMAVLFEDRAGAWVEVGRTEVIANTHREWPRPGRCMQRNTRTHPPRALEIRLRAQPCSTSQRNATMRPCTCMHVQASAPAACASCHRAACSQRQPAATPIRALHVRVPRSIHADPSFVKRMRLSFNFEKVQRLRVMVVDVDKNVDPKKPGSERDCVSGIPPAHLC